MNELDLSKIFKTKSQRQEFVIKINQISDQVYNTDFSLEKVLMQQFGMEIKDKLLTLFSENNILIQAGTDIKTALEQLRTQAEKLPVVEITLAFEPTDQTLSALNDWFLINFKRQYLLDIKIDKKLIAGVSLNFAGKYFDSTVKPALEKALTESHVQDLPKDTSFSPTSANSHHDVAHLSLGR